MIRLKKKVVILSGQKTDGRFNRGTVIGIELLENGNYLGYRNASEFLNRFTEPRYKVAYIDCVTQRACTEWFLERDLKP